LIVKFGQDKVCPIEFKYPGSGFTDEHFIVFNLSICVTLLALFITLPLLTYISLQFIIYNT